MGQNEGSFFPSNKDPQFLDCILYYDFGVVHFGHLWTLDSLWEEILAAHKQEESNTLKYMISWYADTQVEIIIENNKDLQGLISKIYNPVWHMYGFLSFCGKINV